MTFFSFGPLAHPDCLRLIYNKSKSVKLVFVFYLPTNNKTHKRAHGKECVKAVEDYFAKTILPCNIAFIVIDYDESARAYYEQIYNIDSNNLPIFSIWESNIKLTGMDCKDEKKITEYLHLHGLIFKSKLKPVKKGKLSSKTKIETTQFRQRVFSSESDGHFVKKSSPDWIQQAKRQSSFGIENYLSQIEYEDQHLKAYVKAYSEEKEVHLS